MADSTNTLPAEAAQRPAYPFPPGSVFTDGHRLPRLVVFDLDYTLWPFWVDTHVVAPIKVAADDGDDDAVPTKGRRGSRKQRAAQAAAAANSASATSSGAPGFQPVTVVDKYGETFAFYRDVPHVLQALPLTGIRMGVASRTSAPELGREMLRLLRVPTAIGEREDADAEESETTPAVALKVFDAGLEIYPTNKLRHMEALQKRTSIAYEDFLFFDDESRNRNVETLGVTMFLVRDGVTWDAVEKGVRAWRRRHGYTGGGRPSKDYDKAMGKNSNKGNCSVNYDDDSDYEYTY